MDDVVHGWGCHHTPDDHNGGVGGVGGGYDGVSGCDVNRGSGGGDDGGDDRGGDGGDNSGDDCGGGDDDDDDGDDDHDHDHGGIHLFGIVNCAVHADMGAPLKKHLHSLNVLGHLKCFFEKRKTTRTNVC